MSEPIRYAPSLEDTSTDKPDTIPQLNEQFRIVQQTVFDDSGKAKRAVHAKAHGLVEGTLTIDDALDPVLKQGLFAHEGTHPVILRFSTNAGDVLDDAIGLPRGVAIKVLEVDGDRLSGSEGDRTQDFVMVNAPAFQAKTPEQFLSNLKLLTRTTDRAEWAKKALSVVLQGTEALLESAGLQSAAISSLGGAPNVHPLGETFYSVTPFRYGDYAAKFSLLPISGELLQLTGSAINTSGRPDAIREDVQFAMRGVHARWELRVQLLRDIDKQPIEDPTVPWSEEVSPFQRVGIIAAAPQDSWSPEKVAAIDEGLRFSVWTGLAAHQPLGGINRVRRDTYNHAAEFRARANGCPLHEPTGAGIAA